MAASSDPQVLRLLKTIDRKLDRLLEIMEDENSPAGMKMRHEQAYKELLVLRNEGSDAQS
jgi:hypothetical protein